MAVTLPKQGIERSSRSATGSWARAAEVGGDARFDALDPQPGEDFKGEFGADIAGDNGVHR